jgi:hypothetical protein
VAEPTTPPPVRREGLWLWALAALVLLALVIVLGLRACDDDKETSNTGTPIVTEPISPVPATTPPSITESVAVTTPGGPEPDPPTLPPGGGGGTLVVGTQDLYPALEGSLTAFANQQATGKGVRVVSVVNAEAFWAGRSKVQRLLVVINPKGERPPQVRAGQTVDFSGQVVSNEGEYGVTEPDGMTLLARHGHHVLVSTQDLKLR